MKGEPTMIKSLVAATLGLAACALAQAAAVPAELTPMTYSDTVSDTVPSILPGACRVNVLRVTDGRFGKESIGIDAPIRASAPEPWVDTGLDRLKAYGFTVQHNATPVAGALNLDVRLIRAFTWLGHMRINGMVALDVDLDGGAGKRSEKYRALGSKTNMWGAKDEYVTALNYALNHTVYQMAQSLAQQCVANKLALK